MIPIYEVTDDSALKGTVHEFKKNFTVDMAESSVTSYIGIM